MFKRKSKEKGNTLVLDPVNGLALEDMKKPEGRQWKYRGQLVYLMQRYNGTMTPIELPPKIGETPEKLYRALFWDKLAEALFTLKNLMLEKLKLIGMYVLIGILLLFIFLIFSSL